MPEFLQPVLAPQCARAAPASAQAPAQAGGEQKIEEALHLPSELRAVLVPPDFAQVREEIGVNVFHAQHFLHAETAVGAADAAGANASVRRFTDAEAAHH